MLGMQSDCKNPFRAVALDVFITFIEVNRNLTILQLTLFFSATELLEWE